MSLSLADGLGFNLLEVLWRDFEEPLGFDGKHLSHVLFGCHDELMVDNPLWITVEERGTRVDVDLLVVSD